jgi:hypothetical protein
MSINRYHTTGCITTRAWMQSSYTESYGLDEREEAWRDINSVSPEMAQSQRQVLKDLHALHDGGMGGLRHALMMLGHYDSVDILDRYECMSRVNAWERSQISQ